VKLRGGAELRHQAVIADPVHQHATVLLFVQLAAVDQFGRKRHGSHLPHQRGVETDFVDAVQDVGGAGG
jgi:hypothetical protein